MKDQDILADQDIIDRASLEINIENILERTAKEKRPCKACGVMLWMVQHSNGKIAPYTVDGTNHFVNCPSAASFKKAKAAK